MTPNIAELTENDSLTISEFSSLFGFPPEAIIEAVRRNRTALKKAFYSIPDLAARWCCARSTVYKVIDDSGYEILNLTRDGRSRGKRVVPARVVEKIEKTYMRSSLDSDV